MTYRDMRSPSRCCLTLTRVFVVSFLALLSMVSAAGELSVSVVVDPRQVIGPMPPIWRYFGADEPNYATEPDGAKLLMELGELRPGEVYFRAHNLMTTGDGTPDFKWGSTNLYTEDNGKPVYDWALIDRIIDTYRARGLHPYLELGFMPEALTSAPASVPYRREWKPGAAYAGITAGWSYPPRDDTKWAELIYQWTRHNIERYGRSEVEKWYFEVWNEPNLDFYWSATPEEFYRMHDVAIDAVRRALPTARVGGPDVAGAGGAFMDGFLAHVTSGVNYATGVIGTPTDFLSFHAKGKPDLVDGHVQMGIATQLQTVDEGFAKISRVPSLAHKPVILGENDPEGCAACPGPQNAYRNGTLYSAYTAALYPRLMQIAHRRDINLEGAVTWAFTFPDQPWFAGYRQLATNGVDLAVLNVFRLFSKLGNEQIMASSDGQQALDEVMANGVRGTPDIGVLAARRANGTLAILLWHYHDDDLPGPAARVHLTVQGVARSQKGALWRVDRAHGDAFSAWLAMGRPADPSPAQRVTLIQASRIASVLVTIREGKLEVLLPLDGVALIELRP